ncbi:hypothetical protein COU20_02780 [Candidatus Kaiserbacteria bacterium CG10_big_fil_rev_8_21_14_0_10_59_10]|uniref:Ester cyclase n=1 Tax=Candidatus Kaiserbacteria bacterium CG10_big_fil_rev_8_21_14_0_10_59_10 TaxID=1974612 RepID=A0A2H0U9G4_9BACT|nr:MAG: hypothetical protein COU20_02780 [Candidatus Kaiserbacteria bacterium CG10_big_fil_rev_8_21_14_0_10_59_10]
MNAEQALKGSLEAFSAHDADAFASFFAEGASAYDPQYPEPLRGKDAIRKDIEDFITALPDLSARMLSLVGNSDVAAAEMEITGTHTGPFVTPEGTVPPTNKTLRMQVGLFVRVDGEGKIVENNRYYDMMSVANQLGLS